MIYITLPNFYFNQKINVAMYVLTKQHQDWFKLPVSIHAVTGNFPYCYWNGGYNLNRGEGAFYNDFINMSNNYATPLRFNCANINLKKDDYENTMAHLILKLNESGANSIELSNLELYALLKDRYPNYSFVFSKEAWCMYDMTPDLINSIEEQNIFRFIGIPEFKATDMEYIKAINNRKVLEVPITGSCDMSCKNYVQCKLHEHTAQYNFSGMNTFESCTKRKPIENVKPIITIEDIKEKYIPLGITHFSIGEIINSNRNDVLTLFVNYFIKDEYKYPAIQELRRYAQ